MPAADVEKIARATGDAWFGFTFRAFEYQSTFWIGRVRLHVFHREDPGAACHNHPWTFWTFPLVAYVEEVERGGALTREIVHRFWPTWRPREHTHRIIGAWSGTIVAGVPQARPGPIVTLCLRGRNAGVDAWHYVATIGGRVHRLPWRRYLAIADQHPRS
jgi:hypothetical protein